MKAIALKKLVDLQVESEPLRLVERPIPEPAAGEVRIRVAVCGVCHTELDEIEGRTPPPRLPMILGHQVVGVIDKLGEGVDQRTIGERIGVAWIFSACDLWMEKTIKSVANVTRHDVNEFPLAEANRALLELKNRKIRGAKVLRISS